jgi:hypothetical protein
MSNPPDIQRNLDHCMMNIKGAAEAMADDMHDAAMRLGAAEMMLASASNAVYRHAFQPAHAQPQPGAGEEAAGG